MVPDKPPDGVPGRIRESVLVVDDYQLTRRGLEQYLSRAGYTVLAAEDGKTALGIIEEWRPALVILDVMMPGLSGWEVLRRIRETPTTRDVAVIIMTAMTDDWSKASSWESGCDWHLTKPVAPADLLLLVDRLLRPATTEECPGEVTPGQAEPVASTI